jgi:Phosphorylase superfamily
VSGPTYETPAEAALLASVGASVVGMSTVPEVVAARDEGVRVLVLSLVTNMVVGVGGGNRRRSVKEELEAEVSASARMIPPLFFFLLAPRKQIGERRVDPLFLFSSLGRRLNGHRVRRYRMRRFWRLGN